jgi:hypothetical protein
VDACGKRATFAHASASRGTPPRRQQMSRQISWLTGRRCCLAFPALTRQWPRSASARRLQLRGQPRPSQSGAPDSLFALALAQATPENLDVADYAEAKGPGQRDIKTSLYLRLAHDAAGENDGTLASAFDDAPNSIQRGIWATAKRNFAVANWSEQATLSPDAASPRSCDSAVTRRPSRPFKSGLFSVGLIHVPWNSRNSIDYGAGPFPGGWGGRHHCVKRSRPRSHAAPGWGRAKANG